MPSISAYYKPRFLIANRYEVASRPLMGGMGIVYLCLDRQTNQPVALKTFKPEYLPNREARDRFLKEGTAWVQFGKHPNIVQCYGVEYSANGMEVYLVLELIARAEGRSNASLRAWLTPGQFLPLEQALPFALQIALGMQHAGACLPGFVHCDLKPENLLVGADPLPGATLPRLRVTDFGLAGVLEQSGQIEAVAENEQDLLYRTHLMHGIAGTPAYMAPEQWRGVGICAQTDFFALGAILYEMLCGQRVVLGSSIEQLQANCLSGRLAPLPDRLPAPLRAFLGACLAAQPDERPASWAQMVQLLTLLTRELARQVLPDIAGGRQLEQAERVRQGWAYNSMGLSYQDIGQNNEAVHYFDLVQAVGRAEGALELVTAGLSNLGVAYNRLGDHTRAIQYQEHALALSHQIGFRQGEGVALGNLGNAYFSLGDYQRAIQYFEQSLTIARQIGFRQGEASSLGNLGNVYFRLGDYPKAIQYHEQDLAIARQIGGRHGEAGSLGNLGNAYLCLGDYPKAIQYYEQTLSIAREIVDRNGEGSALGSLGNAYFSLGDYPRAIQYHEQHLAIARQIGDRHGEGNALGNIGSAYNRLGDYPRAIQYYKQDLAIARQIGDQQAIAIACLNLAISFRQQGEPECALPLAQEAVRIFEQIRSPYVENARQQLAQLQGGSSPTRPAGEILDKFARIIQAAVDAAHGNRNARQTLEEIFPQLEQNGWRITDPIRRIWVGEREEAALIRTLDPSDAAIIREILRKLQEPASPASQDAEHRHFWQMLVQVAVDGAHGNQAIREMVEEIFPQLEENGLHITEPIQRIWAGERDERELTRGRNSHTSRIIHEILQKL